MSAPIAVWFSCGAASACAARLAVDKYGKDCVRILNTPVAEEHEDNRRFLNDVEAWLGVEIEIVTNPKWPSNSCVDVWEKRQYMSGVAGAPCTGELKKRARQLWEQDNEFSGLVLGFTVDERRRHDNFILSERDDLIPLLIDAGMTKADCYMMVAEAGIRLPKTYSLGYPNANCIGCVKATSPEYWNHVRKTHPEVFQHRAEQSRDIGARLTRVNGERKFLDELLTTDRGAPMKNMDIECGIFCMEV